MTDDERAIRNVVATWMAASRAGDIDRLRDLMDEDITFLRPGMPPMRGRETALEAFRAGGPMTFEATSTIHEIRVAGDFASMWSHLAISMTTPSGETKRRSGDILTVLRKTGAGSWVLFRDANMLTLEAQPADRR